MKKTILLLACTLIFSCTKNDDSYGGALKVSSSFSLKDSQGADLLDPSNPNSFKESDIKIYFVTDGVEKLMYNSDLDNPDFFTINKEKNGDYTISVIMNGLESKNSSVTTTIIQWNANERDVVNAEYLKGQGSVLKRKVWFNDQLVWEHEFGKDDYEDLTTIIK